MDLSSKDNLDLCPSIEVSAYIDGELAPHEELTLEIHLSECKICREELNQQKTFLFALNSTLEREKDLELPDNFTKIIVTNAESRVSGLRRSGERFNAVFICAALLLFVLFGLGSEAFGTFSRFLDQSLAVLGFAGHMVYSIVLGAAVILKSISSQFVSNSTFTFVLLAGVFVSLLIAFSRLMLRYNRTS
jgi:anti-sigma factor RsiW